MCKDQWRADDDLSLVAFMRRDHAAALRAAGITTVRDLAAAAPDALPTSIGERSRERLAQQARLQVAERDTGNPVYELLPPLEKGGLVLLPEPSPGDVFFDIEGDPFVGDHGLEYLFGAVDAGGFHDFWARDPSEEKAAFEALVDYLMDAWERDPGMHVYHYAPYEPARLQSLSARYDTRVAEVQRLDRGHRLVDLYAVVRQGLRISKESYSIKKLESFYWGHVRGDEGVSDALGSVVAFERWLTDGDDTLLDGIRSYNEDDCRSTLALRDWLEGLRTEGGGDDAYPRPVHGDGHASEKVTEASTVLEQLKADLLAGIPDTGRTAEQEATALLAHLLDWHRREADPEWREYFRREKKPDEELVDDAAPVGMLGPAEYVETVKQSHVWRMAFPPQDTKLGPGKSDFVNPCDGKAVNVLDINAEEGWLTVKRGKKAGAPTFTALIPGGPLADVAQRERLLELGTWVLANGIASPSGQHAAARALLLRTPPRTGQEPGGRLRRDGETASQAVGRLASALDGGVLPVQGPPGTGKTYAGARTIVRLLAEGKRVGVCAGSHKVIANLLDEVCRAATEAGVTLRALQKAEAHQRCSSQTVDCTGDAQEIEDRLAARTVDLVAGTTWLYARPGMQDTLDVLVLDEAGQLSLANAVVVAGTARSIVMLGDPQQLAQPVKAHHKEGAGASALEHLLDGAATVRPDLGVLLDRTWRMHPDVASFVSRISYDGRLDTAPGTERQAVRSASVLGGTGLRFVPVPHENNSAASSEEADAVRRLVADVLADGVWVAADGSERPLQPDDVVVLTPYNAHVNRVRGRFGPLAEAGVRVGTVDKYQGQEAPLVIYTLASSSVEDAPRGFDFLYSLNRLNVAVSRARAVAAIVCSPALLTPPVSKPEHLRLVNALCLAAVKPVPSPRR